MIEVLVLLSRGSFCSHGQATGQDRAAKNGQGEGGGRRMKSRNCLRSTRMELQEY